jgi:L-lactate dehydrogenase complex protein LldG
MNNSKSRILDRIGKATERQRSDSSREAEYLAIDRSYRIDAPSDDGDKLALFLDRLADYGSTVHRCSVEWIAPTIADLLSQRDKRSLIVSENIPQEWLPAGNTFMRELPLSYFEMDRSEGILTGCSVAIAETGTIVLRHVGERRCSTLIPDYHLCVVFEKQVVWTVPEAIRALADGADAPITMISGPSATSDIEMTRIKGVHGPRTLDVILSA